MVYAVFFRNLNLGRRNCPDRRQFEAAFLNAGAGFAESFLTNGTLAFSAVDAHSAQVILAAACAELANVCGLKEPAFLRALPDLARLAALRPFAGVDRSTVYDCYVTFLHQDAVIPAGAALQNSKGDVEVLLVSDLAAMSVVRQLGRSPGSPNLFMEKMLGLPATTRAWNTLLRLLKKYPL
ncbi:hypothetical protein IGB42_00033 [Andreprevotia sp. IGB-42]|uniref:DUF1697 domain-containing protein n=1 Tax=Andreprevotia sp. IGB-42 TaxID=2497473 RepID=UPI00135714B9|nr:DUF1697 domain-containing protein [Andreprevotia sp. IGB-42]KAF0814957.1 hypothetical protein IGB42_00033 [Andreprevotia sp. IGB-42]